MLSNAYFEFIFLQTFVSIQPRTSPPKNCKILLKIANFGNHVNNLDLPRVVERPGVDGHLLRGRDGGDEALEHRVVEDHAEDLPGRACLTGERI